MTRRSGGGPIRDLPLPGDLPDVGRTVWLGGRLDGIVARCQTCKERFVTRPDDPADLCLLCDLRQNREQAINEAQAVKRLLGEP